MARSFQEIGQPIPSSKEWLLRFRRLVSQYQARKNGSFLGGDQSTTTEAITELHPQYNWPHLKMEWPYLPRRKMALFFAVIG
ncbi:hypothetical protein [Laspinema olomoucense]|uniref:hypothetical protein n=1 Tax=Laspinema olomoucense TaxID=3231600 RepID=UPI0021BAAD65|nr:hypothetical protein [Laspinema sp. D3c]MCT7996253.1 hypothetical protein [Laspinema sp. D3c]